jgi:hypothetical protein
MQRCRCRDAEADSYFVGRCRGRDSDAEAETAMQRQRCRDAEGKKWKRNIYVLKRKSRTALAAALDGGGSNLTCGVARRH